jgi:hypothetical protein
MLKPHADLAQKFRAHFPPFHSLDFTLLEGAAPTRSVFLLTEFSTGQLDATAPKV